MSHSLSLISLFIFAICIKRPTLNSKTLKVSLTPFEFWLQKKFIFFNFNKMKVFITFSAFCFCIFCISPSFSQLLLDKIRDFDLQQGGYGHNPQQYVNEYSHGYNHQPPVKEYYNEYKEPLKEYHQSFNHQYHHQPVQQKYQKGSNGYDHGREEQYARGYKDGGKIFYTLLN